MAFRDRDRVVIIRSGNQSVELHPVPGFPGYAVTTAGHVYSTRRGSWRRLNPYLDRYLYVSIFRDGRRFKRAVHTLVLEAFVGPCPVGLEALHGNDVKTDNSLRNLRWGTRGENFAEAIKNGRMDNFKPPCGEAAGNTKLTEAQVRWALEGYAAGRLTQGEIRRKLGISKGYTYVLIKKRRAWKHLEAARG